jgi:Flp pilus assembly protein CpaB
VENIMSSKLFRTRQGTILLGVVAAVLAAIALIVYLNQYRNNVKNTAVPVTVLVAAKPIQQSTSGEVIASSGLYKVLQFKQSAVKPGALTNPAELQNMVAKTGIAAGQQLTTDEFTAASTTNPLAAQLPHGERAVVVPLESPGQVGNQISPGDDVDVYVLVSAANGTPVVHEMLQNMLVMNTNSDGNVTLRATPGQAAELILAAGNDKIWLTLRPPHGSVTKNPKPITTNSLLGG